jgi:hypothetical protein
MRPRYVVAALACAAFAACGTSAKQDTVVGFPPCPSPTHFRPADDPATGHARGTVSVPAAPVRGQVCLYAMGKAVSDEGWTKRPPVMLDRRRARTAATLLRRAIAGPGPGDAQDACVTGPIVYRLKDASGEVASFELDDCFVTSGSSSQRLSFAPASAALDDIGPVLGERSVPTANFVGMSLRAARRSAIESRTSLTIADEIEDREVPLGTIVKGTFRVQGFDRRGRAVTKAIRLAGGGAVLSSRARPGMVLEDPPPALIAALSFGGRNYDDRGGCTRFTTPSTWRIALEGDVPTLETRNRGGDGPFGSCRGDLAGSGSSWSGHGPVALLGG